jgi:hypothetical protein
MPQLQPQFIEDLPPCDIFTDKEPWGLSLTFIKD